MGHRLGTPGAVGIVLLIDAAKREKGPYHLMPDRRKKNLLDVEVAGVEPGPAAWQASTLSITPLPLRLCECRWIDKL